MGFDLPGCFACRGAFWLRGHISSKCRYRQNPLLYFRHYLRCAAGFRDFSGAATLMKSATRQHSILLDGHKTAVSVEAAFWTELKHIARSQGVRITDLLAAINATRTQGNLSSAIRVFVLEHVQRQGSMAVSTASQTYSQTLRQIRVGKTPSND